MTPFFLIAKNLIASTEESWLSLDPSTDTPEILRAIGIDDDPMVVINGLNFDGAYSDGEKSEFDGGTFTITAYPISRTEIKHIHEKLLA